jgi:hexosaminidase
MQFKRYDLWRANYSKAYFDLKAEVVNMEDGKIGWRLSTKQVGTPIYYKVMGDKGNGKAQEATKRYKAVIPVNGPTAITAWALNGNPIDQRFQFSLSTGKKVELTNSPAANYPGDGAFTLVNGVLNEKGLGRSREFLGFEGKDCEAVIDMGSPTDMSRVLVHSLAQGGSWVYPPKEVVVFYSNDGVNYTKPESQEFVSHFPKQRNLEVKLNSDGSAIKARYLKVQVKNFGIIPQGMTGAGHGAWLFVDEIQVF